jgi:hypothetical protein
MSVYTIDSEGAISAFTAGAEFDAYDADSSKRIKKVTGTQVLSFIQQNIGTVVDTTATTMTITAASHASKTVTISSAAPIAVTLPQATGTGNKYHFVLMVAATATQHTIKVANSTDVMQGYVFALTTSSANVIGYGTSASSDTITLNGTTTGGVIGSEWFIEDVKTGFFQVHGRDAPTGTTATPFSATV